MEIRYGILNKEILHKCEEFIEDSLEDGQWNVSDFFWDNSLREGVSGIITMRNVSDDLKNLILECISTYVPPYREAEVQLYAWHKGSGISVHDDGGRYGCTIYLNENWDVNWGGLFVWHDGEELRAHCPTYNTMVLNTLSEDHFVTQVSNLCPEIRYTIQIWFLPV
tara:strand:- start:709 stop:1206 length:498 start_codon:yes stop_codon:yes gene_type:complete